MSSKKTFCCTPAQEGLFVELPEDPGRGRYLPTQFGAEDPDPVLPQPPLAVELSEEELLELTDTGRAVAITNFGPTPQDKASNQDFALSAIIADDRGEVWSFAAVADGVSTKTFWPERSSRIACLAAFKMARSWIREGNIRTLETLARFPLRARLAEALQQDLQRDRDRLKRNPRACPPNFAPDHYRDRWTQDELWYNTTLLLGFLGPRFGFVIHAGDGGIRFFRDQEEKTVLTTGDGLTVETFVSLGVQGADFKLVQFRYEENQRIRLYLATDGIDRSLQRLPDLRYQSLRLDNPTTGTASVRSLVLRPGAESDNASVALLTRPLPPGQRKLPQPVDVRKVEIRQPATVPLPPAPLLPPPPDPRNVRPPAPPEPVHPNPEPPRPPDPAPPVPPFPPVPPVPPVPLREHRLQWILIGLLAALVLMLLGLVAYIFLDRSPEPKAPGAATTESDQSPPDPDVTQLRKPAGWRAVEDRYMVVDGKLDVQQKPELIIDVPYLEELARWGTQVSKLRREAQDSRFAVVAFADQTGDCPDNQKLAKNRSSTFVDGILLLRPELKGVVTAEECACQNTPGFEKDPQSVEARRLVLYAGDKGSSFACPPKE